MEVLGFCVGEIKIGRQEIQNGREDKCRPMIHICASAAEILPGNFLLTDTVLSACVGAKPHQEHCFTILIFNILNEMKAGTDKKKIKTQDRQLVNMDLNNTI